MTMIRTDSTHDPVYQTCGKTVCISHSQATQFEKEAFIELKTNKMFLNLEIPCLSWLRYKSCENDAVRLLCAS